MKRRARLLWAALLVAAVLLGGCTLQPALPAPPVTQHATVATPVPQQTDSPTPSPTAEATPPPATPEPYRPPAGAFMAGDLTLQGIGIYSTYDQVLDELGEPELSESYVGELTGQRGVTMAYEGLYLTLFNGDLLLSASIVSPAWEGPRALRVGDSLAMILDAFGDTDPDERPEDEVGIPVITAPPDATPTDAATPSSTAKATPPPKATPTDESTASPTDVATPSDATADVMLLYGDVQEDGRTLPPLGQVGHTLNDNGEYVVRYIAPILPYQEGDRWGLNYMSRQHAVCLFYLGEDDTITRIYWFVGTLGAN